MGTQAVIERNAKIQDLEQRNQELRIQLTDSRKELVDVKAEKEGIQRSLDQARVKVRNLEDEVEHLTSDTKVKKSGRAIDTAKKKSVQVKPDKGEKYKYTNRPVCTACGGTDVESHSPPEENKDGTFSHRWRCENPDCGKKTFTVKSPISANN